MVNIGNLFKMISKKGITQSKLAENTSISTGNISDWKKGKSMPSAVKLDELATYFDCSVDYLLGRTSNPNMANETYKNGDVIQAIGKDEAQVTVNQAARPQDEMATELLRAFQNMNFVDKIEIINIVLEKTKKSQSPIQQKTYPVKTATQGGQAIVTEQMTWEEMQELESYKDADEDL